MEAIENAQQSQNSSVELIRKLRNDLLKDFLDERYLREYLTVHYNVKELSNVKVEFIKKDVKELLLAPLNEVHYEPMLTLVKESDATAVEEGDHLFFSEIESILIRHLF